MTASEVEGCLKDASEIYFLSNRSILLFFPNEFEAERAYQAIQDFYGDRPVGLIFTMAFQELRLLMADKGNRYVEIKGLVYDLPNLSDNLLNAAREYSIDLYMVYGQHLIESVLPSLGVASFLTQRSKKIDIINYKVIG